MNSNPNKSKTISLLGLAMYVVVMLSCTKNFKEYNTDPRNATEKMINYDNLSKGGFFTTMQTSIFPVGGTGSGSTNAYQTSENLCGDIYGGYHGMTHNWNAAGDNTTYNFGLQWNATAFNLLYGGVMVNWAKIKASTQFSFPDQYAVAQIIKIEAFHRTTDMYGPLPYFKAGTGIAAVYDAQDAIYLSFFKELDSAIAILKPYAVQNARPLALYDAVYSGNPAKWIKFANSLKLRLALRIAYANPTLAKQYAESAVSDSYGVITDNGDNALMNGTPSQIFENPLKGLSSGYNEARMSANMESFLNGYNDPRKTFYFFPSTISSDPSNTYRGIRNGITITNQAPYNAFSILQSNFKVCWLVASETYFLRAEGALRGWNMGGTAQSLYEAGVQTSFDQWTAGSAAAYLQNNTNIPAQYKDPVNSSNNVTTGTSLSTIKIKWNEADNFESKLERIITQKWIGNYPNGQEAWSEFRRTGYPKLFPVVTNNSGGTVNTALQIRRIPYPQSEYQTNSKNVNAGVALLGGADNGGTKLWWDKK